MGNTVHCTLTEYSRIAGAFCQSLALFSALFVVCLSLMCLSVDSFAAISATCQRQLRQPGYGGNARPALDSSTIYFVSSNGVHNSLEIR